MLDEFDAHLNPVLSGVVIEIIEKYFLPKGIQVIMTTHSPSTVAHVKEENLFWMENGQFIEKEKMEIIHLLSSGLSQAGGECDPFLSYLMDPRKPYHILTEGYTDILHLKAACKVLSPDYKTILEHCNFFHMNGVKNPKNVAAFVANFAGKERKVFVLLDRDVSGDESRKEIMGKKGDQSSNIKCELLVGSYEHNKSYCPIEFLYTKETLGPLIYDLEPVITVEDKRGKDKIIGWENKVNKEYKEKNICLLCANLEQKVAFAKQMNTSINKSDFEGFTLTLNIIKQWIEDLKTITTDGSNKSA